MVVCPAVKKPRRLGQQRRQTQIGVVHGVCVSSLGMVGVLRLSEHVDLRRCRGELSMGPVEFGLGGGDAVVPAGQMRI
jgi:hypothetical protein